MNWRIDACKSHSEKFFVLVTLDYSPFAAYRSVDRYNDGRITSSNLGYFLRSQGHHASESELLAIIRRIDTDGDCRVTYDELAEFLRNCMPISGGSFSPARS